MEGQRPGHSIHPAIAMIRVQMIGKNPNGWAVGPQGKWVFADLARRCALGQAMQTNGPLARNRAAASASRAKGPTVQIAWVKAISVGPGNGTTRNPMEGQRPGRSVSTI